MIIVTQHAASCDVWHEVWYELSRATQATPPCQMRELITISISASGGSFSSCSFTEQIHLHTIWLLVLAQAQVFNYDSYIGLEHNLLFWCITLNYLNATTAQQHGDNTDIICCELHCCYGLLYHHSSLRSFNWEKIFLGQWYHDERQIKRHIKKFSTNHSSEHDTNDTISWYRKIIWRDFVFTKTSNKTWRQLLADL